MAENDPKFWRPLPGERAKMAASTNCQHQEFLKYPGGIELPIKKVNVTEATLESWLTKDLTIEFGGELVKPISGLRLLYGICDWAGEEDDFDLPITQGSFDLLMKEWRIPLLFREFIGGFNTRAHKFSIHSDNDHDIKVFLFGVPFWRPIFFQAAISYNKRTNITSAFLISRKGGQLWPILEKKLQNYKHWYDQPVMLPLLLSEIAIEKCHLKLGAADKELNNIEEKIGQHEHLNRPRGDPLVVDFETTTRKINSIGKYMALNAARLQAFTQVLEKLAAFRRDTLQEGLEVQVSGGEVEDMLAYLLDTCHVLSNQAEYEGKRVTGLTQAIYQFMVQKDTKALMELAAESKKDSSIMKTIALLGMVFLPGSYISGLFSMPAFNWDGDGAPIIKSGFRYYWAVTVPVTILVLLAWTLARLLPYKSQRIERLTRPRHLPGQSVADQVEMT